MVDFRIKFIWPKKHYPRDCGTTLFSDQRQRESRILLGKFHAIKKRFLRELLPRGSLTAADDWMAEIQKAYRAFQVLNVCRVKSTFG